MKWIIWLCMSTAIGTGLVITQQRRVNSTHRPTTTEAATSNQRLIFAAGVVEGAWREVPLRFEIEGRLEAMHVVEGQMVRTGQVLAQMDDDLWVQKLEEAKAQLALARAQHTRLFNAARAETLEVARAEIGVTWVRVDLTAKQLRRGINLANQNVITQETLDELRHNYDLAVAELKRAQARLAEVEAPARGDDLRIAEAKIALAATAVLQARTMVHKTVLVAPSGGMILRVTGEVGELIGPETQEPLFSMTNVNEVRVRAFVEELDAVAISVGQSAYVTADGKPTKRFRGTVVNCAPSMVPKRMRTNMPGERLDIKVREVVIVLQEAQELVVGLPVDVFIHPKRPATTDGGTPSHPGPVIEAVPFSQRVQHDNN